MNITKILSLLLFIIISFPSFAQEHTLKGKVSGADGKSIPYASIFIKESKTGSSSNADGDFSINIPTGKYHLVFSYMGYRSKEIEITIPTSSILEVTLKEQKVQVKEVRVYSGGEDPAVSIMKNAIVMSSYYKKLVEKYDADVYLRGAIKFDKIPWLIQKMIDSDDESNKVKEGDILSIENMSHVNFSQPNHYEQTVKAVNFVGPKDFMDDTVDPIEFFNMSIYEDANGLISPLSPRAFSYYKFAYLGYFTVGDRNVNKIRITPRNNNKQCFSGEICIFDNTWNVYSVNLKSKQNIGDFRMEQVYNDMGKEAYMPTQNKIYLDISYLGAKLKIDYVSSIKYNSVELNNNLKQPYLLEKYYAQMQAQEDAVAQQKAENEQVSKEQKKLDELLMKEDLSRRDLVRISKLSNKIDRQERAKENGTSDKPSLEVVDNHHIKVDTLASKKGDEFWKQNRSIPLSIEQKTYVAKQDSIQSLALATKSDDDKESKDEEPGVVGRILGSVVHLNIYKSKDDSVQFAFTGVSNTVENFFNPVNGWMLWTGLRYDNDYKRINSKLKVGYGFSSKSWMFSWNGTKEYNWRRRGTFSWDVGSVTRDFKGDDGMNVFVDEVTALFFKDNYRRFYQSDYISLNNQIDITNGLVFKAGLKYESRKQQQNNTDYSFFKKDDPYHSNTPENGDITPDMLADSDASGYTVELSYTPRMFYRLDKKDKRKRHLGSNYPTFTVGFKQNIAIDALDTESKYKHLWGEIKQQVETGYDASFNYTVSGGKLWDVSHFSEFNSFRTQRVPFSITQFDPSNIGFMIPKDYSLNEKEWYFNTFVSYETQYILLKYLPYLNNTLMKESISVNYLKSGLHENYVEVGYSLNNIFLFGSLGVFAGYEKGYNPRYGVKASFKF
ncbi:DUF5686 and carboxypeptidase regulatory-like domain-containing protein [Halosquirtibacter xylanolyticus]|uniref:DUF5686 and carboxypeptidase regulatory-like domain-containing protein n=1 Tax=Halosquirtibacter xylanolyticus TaxID=3374599 RepID=UPI0037496005|nr:DUF5686 and carboxypeptidase regulatory-like domain-containing protein [Prolixibacteraceae bacterium]